MSAADLFTLQHILYPTAGEPSAGRAWLHATYLAQRHAATLHILHVELHADGTDRRVEIRETNNPRYARTEPEQALEHADLLEPAGPSMQVVECTARAASVPDGVLAYAARHDVSLIVVGTTGRRGFERIRVGGVAEEILRRADCPVLTVCGDGEAFSPDRFQRMLVPIDFEQNDTIQLARARIMAHVYNAGVDLLHVVADTPLPTGDRIDLLGASPKLQARAWERLEQMAERLREDGVDVLTHVREGQPAQEVIAFAQLNEVDVILVTTRGRKGLNRWLLGSVAETVIRQAPCPVVSIRLTGRRAQELLARLERPEARGRPRDQ